MKKLFTLLMVLAVATVGYSQVKVSRSTATMKAAKTYIAPRLDAVESLQNVQLAPSMTRTDGELDYSTYDWQSNHGARTWTTVWPDGTVGFAYTMATTTNFSDRGTGIGLYKSASDEWIPLGGRIENEKTGFGSMARYGENGLVVAAHTATDLGIYIVEDKDNMTPNSVGASLYTGSELYTHPAVMTSGPDRKIIHVAAAKFGEYEGESYEPIRYWRSSDGGQTWDKECVELPYLTTEYGINWGTNSYYWMETSADNRLALVINCSWSDGMVIYSDDNGETWERKVFYHHPGPKEQFATDQLGFCYPRWTSCQWGANDALCVAYEWNGTNDIATSTSGSYYPGLGGVAFWSDNMPYAGEGYAPNGYDPTNPMPPVTGETFIMDSAYIYNDIYAAWPRWSDQSWDNPAYIGYVPCLGDDNQWEDWDEAESFNIEDFTLHGTYNSGVAGFPALCIVPGTGGYDMVAVWSCMDEHHTDGASNFYYKLFASYSGDGGLTWSTMVHLTGLYDLEYDYSECVYPQAAVIGDQLIVAAQLDDETGTFVQSDETDATNNLYQGFTFNLNEIFPDAGVSVPEISHNTNMVVYPNPATDRLNVTLNQATEIVIYNIMGQVVATKDGKVGENIVELSNLSNGVYFVNAGTSTQKFIVK